jgi:hypothetical protein
MIGYSLFSNNSQAQMLGIDRAVSLSSGKTIYIDEKKRRKNYSDILIEYISNDGRNTPGWIEKDLMIDYLAYAFMPDKRVYLFDWLMLRRAWKHYSELWKSKYYIAKANNGYYKTISVAVPIEVVLKATDLARIIQL